ncbi:MAG: polysaccharide biosynthesis protein [Bauldia sp.]|nr:polysaccharide biosynthesis protein [Bauldia sp.]
MGLLSKFPRRLSEAVPRFTPRLTLVLVHDLAATAAAIMVAFYIRLYNPGIVERADEIRIFLPLFVLYAAIVYILLQLYRTKWRFASLPDLVNIFRASTILALSLLVLDYILVARYFYGDFFFGKVTIFLYWCLQMFFLGGPRILYRYFRYTRTRHSQVKSPPTHSLLVGNAADAEVYLRAIENGAVSRVRIAAILSPSHADQRQVLRGVSVVGRPDDLQRAVSDFEARDIRIGRAILTPSALHADAHPEQVLMQARRIGITVQRVPSLDVGEPLRLAPVEVEDLLVRPSIRLDHALAAEVIAGKAVAVTGGGGSIGAELCRRILSFGAARLLVVENAEPALHAITETLAASGSQAEITGRIADVRDRDRIARLFAEFGPDLVFHAAALKHVPIVEENWAEGVKTNVFGTVNVADAARACGARSMILISTDKAIEPLSMLGATKRFAELYCQAVDADLAARRPAGQPAQRFISVRFGNVLGSNGSVVPKFKAQIEAGGPVTITHQDMVRYFMTIREACDLVVAATGHAVSSGKRHDPSVYVLNMGQPVHIRDLAERMIRLHGLEPGVDIEISYTGIRPGERTEELLFAQDEQYIETGIHGVVAAVAAHPAIGPLRAWIGGLTEAVIKEDKAAAYRILSDAIPDFKGKAA